MTIPQPGTDPKIYLYHSDDGGKTWSNGRLMDIGKTGEYLTRCRALRCGYSRDRVFRVVTTEPVKIVIVGARADIEIEA